ncbi:hypothetical protein [Phyllobacterium sophorae]|uniref:Rap1a immunity protein domain-containing protein n=1 Tax=Phyllobacterium sophorae TaxID=1520277 RepID=A0A2P7B532_9HYPH|nr:hypothetical protein [Phyllobacterium sophorae]PSH61578.1 hypothetical protein CU103_22475 [Phyllobacterium sophorae]
MKLRLLLFFLLLSSPAGAMTAAELLDAEKRFATGYIFGAVEYQTGVAFNDDFAARRQEIRQCLLSGQFTSDALYVTVTAFIRNHPGTRQNSAVRAIVQAVNEICPQGGK